jgi:uncharacterized protein YndB with AHSA1/START domain
MTKETITRANNIIAIASATSEAYVAKDRAAIERLIAGDFHFTSPLDNRLDRATYFARCWPNSERFNGFISSTSFPTAIGYSLLTKAATLVAKASAIPRSLLCATVKLSKWKFISAGPFRTKLNPVVSFKTTRIETEQERYKNMTTNNQLAESVVVERVFNAPVAQVWKALTDVDQMREWYFDLKEFKPEVGFEFEFSVEHEGTTYNHLCRVTEVIPQKKIAYTWRYKDEPGDSLVTFELSREGEKTRVNLTHSGIETFPKTPAYARKNFETGWTQLIGTELKQFVEKTEKEKS